MKSILQQSVFAELLFASPVLSVQHIYKSKSLLCAYGVCYCNLKIHKFFQPVQTTIIMPYKRVNNQKGPV